MGKLPPWAAEGLSAKAHRRDRAWDGAGKALACSEHFLQRVVTVVCTEVRVILSREWAFIDMGFRKINPAVLQH